MAEKATPVTPDEADDIRVTGVAFSAILYLFLYSNLK